MKSIQFILIFIAWTVISGSSNGQAKETVTHSFSLGISAGALGHDHGIGIEIGSPALFRNHIHFRLKGGVNWLEQYKSAYDQWATYKTLTVSLVYNIPLSDRSRAYFELGTYFTFPDEKLPETKSVQGLTTSIGVELFLMSNHRASYYFGGGIGYAEKMEDDPQNGYGFVFNNGLRFYF